MDVSGAFMQANMDEQVFILMVIKMTKLLVEIDPDTYKDYICYERGEPVS